MCVMPRVWIVITGCYNSHAKTFVSASNDWVGVGGVPFPDSLVSLEP